MALRIPKRIKEFVPSDILDDGPQAMLTIALGAVFGAWITAKGHSIHWLSGWPLGFLAAIVVSLFGLGVAEQSHGPKGEGKG